MAERPRIVGHGRLQPPRRRNLSRRSRSPHRRDSPQNRQRGLQHQAQKGLGVMGVAETTATAETAETAKTAATTETTERVLAVPAVSAVAVLSRALSPSL